MGRAFESIIRGLKEAVAIAEGSADERQYAVHTSEAIRVRASQGIDQNGAQDLAARLQVKQKAAVN